MPIFFPCGGVAMGISKEFDRYMAHLAEGLGHAYASGQPILNVEGWVVLQPT